MSDRKILRVVVKDLAGRPISDARVMIETGPEPTPDIAALSDARGIVTLSLPGTGRYRLRCAADGFADACPVAEVGAEPTGQLVVELAPAR